MTQQTYIRFTIKEHIYIFEQFAGFSIERASTDDPSSPSPNPTGGQAVLLAPEDVPGGAAPAEGEGHAKVAADVGPGDHLGEGKSLILQEQPHSCS